MNRRNLLLGFGAVLNAASGDKPAALGGAPVRTEPFPDWPISDELEQQMLTKVLKSGQWFRGNGKQVDAFEAAYAKLTGSPHCLATANGTSALLTVLGALNVGPGDEVIVPPYTFVATINVVLQVGAVPVFVDTDRETFQMDARKLGAALTPRTAAIMPVHMGGNVADMDAIMAIASKRNIPVIEDACQAHLAEWKSKKAGTIGKAGCFSFQASKNLNCGEGGAVLTADKDFLEEMFAFHNNSRGRTGMGYDFKYTSRGLNLRLAEFQGAILQAQMTRLNQQARRRDENAAYLTKLLADVAGIHPAKQYPGTTRNAYHLYMFRYDPAQFGGLSHAKFLNAMRKEGIPVSAGYSPLNKEPFLKNTLESKGYQRLYGQKFAAQWVEKNQCPENDKLCDEAVWLTQTMLIGKRVDMEHIAAAIVKVKKYAGELARA